MICLFPDAAGVWKERFKPLGFGRLFVAKRPDPFPGEKWALDNGAYGAWVNKTPFPEERFLRQLERALAAGDPMFTVIPDIVAAGEKSYEFSWEWLERIYNYDTPLYLALQDGVKVEWIEEFRPSIAGLFLGGTNEFKFTEGHKWAQYARDRDLGFHYGRCSTWAKMKQAYRIHATSLDSSQPLWTKEKWSLFVDRMERIEHQRSLPGFGRSTSCGTGL